MDKRVSPFSTPPSSEGDSLPDESLDLRPSGTANWRKGSIQGHEPVKIPAQPPRPSTDPRALDFSQFKPAAERRDARMLGFASRESEELLVRTNPSRAITFSAGANTTDSRTTGFSGSQPSQRLVPGYFGPSPGASVSRTATLPTPPTRDSRLLGLSRDAQLPANPDEGRPGLPPRRMGGDPPPRPSEESKRGPASSKGHYPSQVMSGRSVTAARALQNTLPKSDVNTNLHFPPPPKRHTMSEYDSPLFRDQPQSQTTQSNPTPYQTRLRQLDDSDEEGEATDEPSAIRTEFPDASQANRRPPIFRDGVRELSIRTDTKASDVSGQFLCTAGHSTRVFDMSTGEKLMEQSYGDTVKVLSVVFKPAQDVNSEGSRIWVGNNIGELHEIDVATQGLIATSTSHYRREVIQILRRRNDLWTLDDEGKLFVWRPDETGSPNLKYSHQAHRVQKGHTFSMVIRDQLWLATGKEIWVHKPGNEATFDVLQNPLVQSDAKGVTSGCFANKDGGIAYFGHADGRVTIYSTKDYNCIGNVKVSNYKIVGLAFVGDRLWTAFRTGKIYVYETSSTPWQVKKVWQAHREQINGLLLDPSSIWTMQRLQVLSIGHDQYARLWDGLMEEDWLENAMHGRDVEYCTFREIKAAVVTWNVGACNPLDVRSDFICDAIHPEDPPELLVFGFQEIVDLEDRAVTAKSILGLGKKKDANKSDQHVSRVYREWRDYLAKCINRYMAGKYRYLELHTSSLIGLFQCVFVRHDEHKSISNLSATNVKCGMKGRYGNKASSFLHRCARVLTPPLGRPYHAICCG